MLRWLEWLALAAATFYALAGVYFIRSAVREGRGVTYATIFSNLWWLVSLVVVLLTGYSRLHLVWLYLVGFVAGMFFTMVFPLNLVGLPLAKLYGAICCIGLNQGEMARNTARQKYAERRISDLSSRGSYGQAKETVVREIRGAYDYVPRRMLELTQTGSSDEDAATIVAEEIAELQGDAQYQALLTAKNLPSPLATNPSPRGRWVMQLLLTLGYGLLVALWNTVGAIAAVYFVSLAGYELEEWAFRWIGWLFSIPVFAWLMPRTGRPAWHSLGMVVPLLNIYLGWTTLWRVAGQKQ